MLEEIVADRFILHLPFYVAGCGAIAILLIDLCQSFDTLELLYVLIGMPIVCLILLITAIVLVFQKEWRHSLWILLAIVVYCGSSWVLVKNSADIRFTERWLLHSKAYKAELLAGACPQDGMLPHMEWDGWGGFGSDTVVYLVYDPKDSLLPAAKSHLPGKFKGISCEVLRVYRLESHWYSVVFYTETAWDSCTY